MLQSAPEHRSDPPLQAESTASLDKSCVVRVLGSAQGVDNRIQATALVSTLYYKAFGLLPVLPPMLQVTGS